ncbi:MAG: hypothetical protein WBA62_22040 [Xanthobacteraceae bacterium]
MKVALDPFPDSKAAAIARVNAYFGGLAATAAMKEAAWKRKRSLAEAVKAGDAGTALTDEAALRNLTVQAFADLILSKPDPAAFADARELRRQTALLAIDAAKTPAELDAIIASLGA